MTSEQTHEKLVAYLDNPHPTVDEAVEVFTPLTEGDYDDVHIAALLATIRTRGETMEDIVGAAKAFLAAARPFPITGEGILDTAGTGGDGANTINVTTAASLVAAAGGVKMLKCGNRSVSSKSGSADVLEALGIPVDLDVDAAVEQFKRTNFTFLFAPLYHPAVAHVQPVRRALRIPTLFNTLGPILSPARPEFQIMGIANPRLGRTIAEVFRELGRRHVLVVHGSGIDEVAVHGPTTIWELKDGDISEYEITPEDLGLSTHPLEALSGGTGEENAGMMRETFAGGGSPAHRDAIVAAAGAMFYTAQKAASLAEGVTQAQQLLDSGAVERWLQEASRG